MEKADLLEKLKRFYSSTFDLEENYQVGGHMFSLYGHFNVDNSQYVLSKRAKLWEANCQEHLFVQMLTGENRLDVDALKALDQLLRQHVEPEYVRHGEKLPPENHMYTYLTLVVITDGGISPETIDFAKKYKFEKMYMFNIRGYVETRLVVISADEKQITTNGAGKPLVKAYRALLG